MNKGIPISLEEAFKKTVHYPDRTPNSSKEESKKAYAVLSEYRDGATFIANYAGNSEWERHPVGDEIVMVIEGETTLFLLIDGKEVANKLKQGEYIIVPQNSWHRFETPNGVKAFFVTPQPTDHQSEFPKNA